MKFTSVIIIFSALWFSSCAFHAGNMQSSASLSDGNFKVLGVATGSAKVIRVLGLGGVSTQALVFDAKQNLYEHYPLEPGQVLANTTVDFKRSYFFLWQTTTATVSGEIVEFISDESPKQPSNQKAHLTPADTSFLFYRTGQDVFVHYRSEYWKGEIVDFDNRLIIIRFMYDNKLRFRTFPREDVFTIRPFGNGSDFKSGEAVKVPQAYNASLFTPQIESGYFEAEIIAFGPNEALVSFRSKSGVFSHVDKVPYVLLEKYSSESNNN